MNKKLIIVDSNGKQFKYTVQTYLCVRSYHVQKGINFEANDVVQRVLSGVAFRLYAYLVKKGWYTGEILLCSMIEENTHLTLQEQVAAVDELVEKGYMTCAPVWVKDVLLEENAFYFWESPHHAEKAKANVDADEAA